MVFDIKLNIKSGVIFEFIFVAKLGPWKLAQLQSGQIAGEYMILWGTIIVNQLKRLLEHLVGSSQGNRILLIYTVHLPNLNRKTWLKRVTLKLGSALTYRNKYQYDTNSMKVGGEDQKIKLAHGYRQEKWSRNFEFPFEERYIAENNIVY